MFAVVLAAALVGANAFAPSSSVRSSALKMSFENELGVIRPTGFWDPLGLTKNMDQEVSCSPYCR